MHFYNISCLALSCIFMLIFGLTGIRLFTSPISLILLLVIVFSVVVQTKWYQNWQKKRDEKKAQKA